MLGGRYDLTEPLGGGETGEVWRARDRGAGRDVAVKMLPADPRLADRFLRARGILTGLTHPSIARLLDVVITDDSLALVTDLASGVDLRRRLAHDGPLPAHVAAGIAAEVADALATAHRVGVVHGDLKPSNVLFDGSRVQVTDFSVALFVRAGRYRAEISAYSAPDVIDGAVPGPSSDVYALGVLLCEMVTGDTAAWELNRSGSEDLARVVDECVRRDPSQRPDAHQVHQRLLTLLDGPLWVDPSPPEVKPAKKNPYLVPVAALAVLALAVWAVIAALPGSSNPDSPAAPPTSPAPQTLGPPTPPAPARTQQGGQAFVEHWFALFTYVVHSGDTTLLAGVTNPECAQCRQGVDAIEAGHVGGGTLTGGAFAVRRMSTSSLWTPERPVYDVTIDRTPRSHVDSAGVIRATLPGLSFVNCVLVLDWTTDRWRLLEITTPGCLT